MSVKSWCGTCMQFTFGCTHAEAPIISTGVAIDDETREALKVAIHSLTHNGELAKSRAEDAAESDRPELLAYADTQLKSAAALSRLAGK